MKAKELAELLMKAPEAEVRIAHHYSPEVGRYRTDCHPVDNVEFFQHVISLEVRGE